MRRKIQAGRLVVAAGIVLVALGLLFRADVVGQGIRDGIAVCGTVLIPSLFPFMVLSGFVGATEYAGMLSRPLRPVTTKLYKLPEDMGIVVLLSLIGGFPVGAKMIAGMMEQGKLDRETAQRMLCFCVNSGPSFVISAVGVGMLSSLRAGVALFAIQTAATLIVGAGVSFRAKPPKPVKPRGGSLKGGTAFVQAVAGASSAMLAMCAFAVLFSGILALIQDSGLVGALSGALSLPENVVGAAVCGFLEVTTGCIRAAELGGIGAVVLLSACVSFCGLSVLFQIMACFSHPQFRFRPLILSRLAHMLISCGLTWVVFRSLAQDQAVWLPTQPPVMHSDSRTLVISICLLAMCSILVLSTDGERKNHK